MVTIHEQHDTTDSREVARLKGDFTVLRVCLLASVAYAGLGLVGFAGFAGFWPPPGPDLSAAEIAGYFQEHNTSLRIGLVLMAMCGPFYFVWSAAVSRIISRMEGPFGILSTIELLGGLLTGLVTFTPAVIWLTAAYRADVSPDTTVQTLYDYGWFFFDATFVCSALQQVALAVAIMRDDRPQPLMPKWVAWVALLSAGTYLPLTLIAFFHSGPLAWNGLLCFWVVFVGFFVMVFAITATGWPALRRIEQELLDAGSIR